MGSNVQPEKCLKTVLYLCSGLVPYCGKQSCFKRGGPCRHTTDVSYALNPEGSRRFSFPNELNQVWEVCADPKGDEENGT